MRENELRYLTSEVVSQINTLVEGFITSEGKLTPEQLIEKVKALLPIEKIKPDTVKRRVEGYYYTSEFIFKRLLKGGQTRPGIVHDAGLKPLSHYHYLVGSREPANLLLTRDDYLNDPSTSLIKLHDDIVGIANLLLKQAH